jgi:hypothetical protein
MHRGWTGAILVSAAAATPAIHLKEVGRAFENRAYRLNKPEFDNTLDRTKPRLGHGIKKLVLSIVEEMMRVLDLAVVEK